MIEKVVEEIYELIDAENYEIDEELLDRYRDDIDHEFGTEKIVIEEYKIVFTFPLSSGILDTLRDNGSTLKDLLQEKYLIEELIDLLHEASNEEFDIQADTVGTEVELGPKDLRIIFYV